MPWEDLKTRGFVHVPGFLGASEIARLRADYAAAEARLKSSNAAATVGAGGWAVIDQLRERLSAVTDAIAVKAGIHADVCSGAVYFGTRRGANFPWHQDHESFYLYQESYHYLNFYLPFVKPVAALSNVCLVPFDALRASIPGTLCDRLVASGAHRFEARGDSTEVLDDENGTSFTIPVQLDALAATPHLQAGDLLLLRGDMIHRTQDAETDRVALSIRRQSSRSTVSRQRLAGGGPEKRKAMAESPILYQLAQRCFAESGKENLEAGELIAYLARRTRPRAPAPAPAA